MYKKQPSDLQAGLHDRFSLVPYWPDDGSLCPSRNMLQWNSSTSKQSVRWAATFPRFVHVWRCSGLQAVWTTAICNT